MRVSVVIPCREDHGRLLACLDALDAQDLSRAEFEIIVVDGGPDGSDAALAGRARLLADGGRGPAAARNVGIRAARGKIVAFTDADCVPRFDWLLRLVDAFDANADLAGVAGGLRLPRQRLLGRMEDNDARTHYRGYITSNIAYRRDVLEAVGGFDESLRCAEDYDLAWRVLDAGYRIEHEPGAIVLHDPPEVEASLDAYLLKQIWYARHDVPAHARALLRAWHARRLLPGSRLAIAGGADALQNAAWTLGLGLAIALRSPKLLTGVLGGTMLAAARGASRTIAVVGEGERELPLAAMTLAAKRLVRGAGTLVGLADLARPQSARRLRRAGPSPWPREAMPARLGPATPA